jgi:8-oxo-dGTP pyrophosphatase MutT (NUDIX family)
VIVRVVAAIIRREGQILITRRPDNVHLAGLWEFPGGKVEPDESLQTALRREIREELGVTIEVLDERFQIQHDYPPGRWSFISSDPNLSGSQALAVTISLGQSGDLDQFDFPGRIAAHLAENGWLVTMRRRCAHRRILPSRMLITRCAYSTMSRSCVTRMIVLPSGEACRTTS